MLTKRIFLSFLVYLTINEINSANVGRALVPLVPSENYTDSTIVDNSNPTQFRLYWKVLPNEEIQFEYHCKSTGWAAFGISPQAGMTGADIMMGWFDSNGRAQIRDTYATGNRAPVIDTIQNWDLLDAAKINGYLIFKVKRKWNTCDKEQDFEIKYETNYLVFAFNNNAPLTGNGDWTYHGRMGRRSVVENLLAQPSPPEPIDPNAITAQFNLNNHVIKSQRTYSYCQFFEFPSLSSAVHLTHFDAVVTSDLVHQMIIYECDIDVGTEGLEGLGYECGAASVPDTVKRCIASPIIAFWGFGSQLNFAHPKDAGYLLRRTPIGKKYLMLEVQYDNPTLLPSQIDNSGIKFYMISNLRRFDVGVLTLKSGTHPVDLTILPQMANMSHTSVCHSDCTTKFLPVDGINIYSGILHARLAGRAMRTKVVRNNNVVKYLFDNQYYDFNYQYRADIEAFKLNRGDQLILECRYNTIGRDNVTFFGYNTLDELCYNMMFYYPKTTMDTCNSIPTYKSLFDFYRQLANDKLIPPIILNELLPAQSLNEIKITLESRVTFTDELRARFQQYYRNTGQQFANCGSFGNINSIVNLEKPFPTPTDNLAPIDKCPAN